MQILHIARLCHKKFDKHIIMSIPSLISLGMVGMLEVSKHTKLSQKDNTVLAMIRNSQATDRKGVAKWLELVISLVSNNSNSYHNIRNMSMDQYLAIINGLQNPMNQDHGFMNVASKDQKDFIILIIGL